MSNDEPTVLLNTEIAKYRVKPYAQLVALVRDENHPAFEVIGGSGMAYWLEIEVFQDLPILFESEALSAVAESTTKFRFVMTFSRRRMNPSLMSHVRQQANPALNRTGRHTALANPASARPAG